MRGIGPYHGALTKVIEWTVQVDELTGELMRATYDIEQHLDSA